MEKKDWKKELDKILKGIDEQETQSEDGWWETSIGAEFGRATKEVLIEFISLELDKAREEGKLYALDSLKDYIFINNTHRNKDLPLTWDDLRHYIKEAEQIYSEELSKLTTK